MLLLRVRARPTDDDDDDNADDTLSSVRRKSFQYFVKCLLFSKTSHYFISIHFKCLRGVALPQY